MIISKAPFRISFAGGGSDLSAYYSRKKGAVLSATVNRYMYLCIHPYFNRHQTLLKYSQTELVNNVEDIKHPILREVMKELSPSGGLEIVSMSDVPSGTGLGSSSSFVVALLHALCAYHGKICSKEFLSQKACEIEIEKLGEPIGKQDQYAAAYGGMNLIEFNTNGGVLVNPLILPKETIAKLEENLLLFYTGNQRDTRTILHDQNLELSSNAQKIEMLDAMVELAYKMRDFLIAADFESFAHSLHESWMLKKTLSSKISNSHIETVYQTAISNGALGGKLLGAGAGGFVLFYCEKSKQDQLKKALAHLNPMKIRFEWGGSQIIYVGDQYIEAGFIA